MPAFQVCCNSIVTISNVQSNFCVLFCFDWLFFVIAFLILTNYHLVVYWFLQKTTVWVIKKTQKWWPWQDHSTAFGLELKKNSQSSHASYVHLQLLMSLSTTMNHRSTWRTFLQSELLMQPMEATKQNLCSSHRKPFQTRLFIAQRNFSLFLKRTLKICCLKRKKQCHHLMTNQNCQPRLMVMCSVLEIALRILNLEVIKASKLIQQWSIPWKYSTQSS